MPASVRKSSIGGNRRGPQKYIPYRADDFQHGKRTGIAVNYVEHNSDDFEPFDRVLKQADQRTPPRPKINGKKKRTPKAPVVQEFDEDGERSMELEDSYPNSPGMYFANARVGGITSSVQRVGSSSRPVARASDVDFDKVPSPRPRTSSAFSHRQSIASTRSAGPSHLSRSSTRRDMGEEDTTMDNGGANEEQFDDYPAPYDDDSDNEPLPSLPQSSRSFTQIDGEEDAEEEEQIAEQVLRRSSSKGKQRVVAEDPPEKDVFAADDLVPGPDDLGMDNIPPDEDQAELESEPPKKTKGRKRDLNDSVESPQRASKKTRIETEGQKKPKGRSRKENAVLREVVQDINVDEDGLRRGKRKRYAPLEWWRLEKVVYGRREGGLVPAIKEIRRLPKEEPQPLGAKYRKRRGPRSKSRTAGTAEPVIYNPEEDWDINTEQNGVVIDFERGTEVQKRVAYTARMVQPKPAANSEFLFDKIFGDGDSDGDFIAAGQLIIPPGKQKPTKGTKDNTFVFFVAEGAVNFKVHRTSFVIATGGMFLVPRGNMYFIQNISDRDAKLFFAQARKLPPDNEGGSNRRQSHTTSRSPSRVGAGVPPVAAGPTPADIQPLAPKAEGRKATKRA